MNRALPSVKAQTYTDWDCHVIGDGTDDVTEAAMTELCMADRRFRFTNLPRQQYPEGTRWDNWGLLGLVALNYGLDHARGGWIAVLDDDDEFLPRHHEDLIAAAVARDADFAYGRSITPWGQEYGSWPPGDAAIAQGSYVYRRKAMEYRYDLNCVAERGLNGDADLWTRMFAEGVRFTMISDLVHHYDPAAARKDEA